MADDLIGRETALKALEEISYSLWEIDIPSPTVPEYIEHHEQVQGVMKLVDGWARKIQAAMPAPAEPRKGQWIDTDPELPDLHYRKNGMAYACSVCGHRAGKWKHTTYKYCPWCGAKMKGEQDG